MADVTCEPKIKTTNRAAFLLCAKQSLPISKVERCERPQTVPRVSIHDEKVNCDGILSIKASRYWRKCGRSGCFENQMEMSGSAEEISVCGIPILTGLSRRLDEIKTSEESEARAQIVFRPFSGNEKAKRQDERIVGTVSDLETTADSASSDMITPPSPTQTVPLVRTSVHEQSSFQQGRKTTGNRFSLDSRNHRRYRDARPSNFCHVCQRYQKRNTFAICTNIKNGLCRKVVCHECFLSNGWDWEKAMDNCKSWCCPHCTDTCPRRAQCFTYGKTNNRRRLGIMKKRNFTRNRNNQGM